MIKASLTVAVPTLQLTGQVKHFAFPPVSPKQFPGLHVTSTSTAEQVNALVFVQALQVVSR